MKTLDQWFVTSIEKTIEWNVVYSEAPNRSQSSLPQCPSLFRSYDSFVYENITPSFTELNNMEWNYLVSPSQADGKHCVHIVFFFTPFSPSIDWSMDIQSTSAYPCKIFLSSRTNYNAVNWAILPRHVLNTFLNISQKLQWLASWNFTMSCT